MGTLSLLTLSLMCPGFGDSKSNRRPSLPPSQASVVLPFLSFLFCTGAGSPRGNGFCPVLVRGGAFHPSPKAALLTWDGNRVGGKVSCPFSGGMLLLPPLKTGSGMQLGQFLAPAQQQMAFACH